jgi:hypothetical protein
LLLLIQRISKQKVHINILKLINPNFHQQEISVCKYSQNVIKMFQIKVLKIINGKKHKIKELKVNIELWMKYNIKVKKTMIW